jgi:hypothetical protein
VAAERDADLLVYPCPRLGEFAASDGAPGAYRGGFLYPPRRDDGTRVWEPEAAIAATYPRIDPITAHELAGRLHPGASPTGAYPLAVPPDVRTALIYTTQDELFTPDTRRPLPDDREPRRARRCPRSAHHRSAMSQLEVDGGASRPARSRRFQLLMDCHVGGARSVATPVSSFRTDRTATVPRPLA